MRMVRVPVAVDDISHRLGCNRRYGRSKGYACFRCEVSIEYQDRLIENYNAGISDRITIRAYNFCIDILIKLGKFNIILGCNGDTKKANFNG
jgi:hypothetical protein